MNTKRNARFWIGWRGDYVKVTMRPGDRFELSEGGPSDEGWWRRYDGFEFDGETVTRDWCEDGVDCDGRLSSGGILACHVDRLRSHVGCEDAPGLLPAWDAPKRWQRDYTAEAAGY